MTAVEWLIKELYFYPIDDIVINKFNQAREIEKDQITDAYIAGSYDILNKEFNPKEYYNITFK